MLDDGRVLAWGGNRFGQLGLGCTHNDSDDATWRPQVCVCVYRHIVCVCVCVCRYIVLYIIDGWMDGWVDT